MLSKKAYRQVRLQMNILDVVQWYDIDVKKVGVEYKCLCPFHNEKTASLSINKKKNAWICFGCGKGGSPIDFVMEKDNVDFTRAIEIMASHYDIPVEQEPDKRTPEEIRNDLRKESIYILYKNVQKYFVEQLNLNEKAKAYALSRWDEKQLKEDGFGFCPYEGLVKYAQDNELSIELMKEVGLLKDNDKGKTYNFFYNRITIPIYDKYSRIIGYTARILNTAKNQQNKYFNSCNSIVYEKKNSIFGINSISRSARDEDKVYLVEGAPDSLRLHHIGIYNAIASLGGNWSDQHFETIREYASTLCFIPDADPIKNDQEPTQKEGEETQTEEQAKEHSKQLGVGAQKVIDAGKKAIELGFSVLVKEIPLKDDGKKNDADEYFTSKQIFTDLPEQDFVLWRARQILNKDLPTDINMPAIKEIVEIIGMIKDHSHAKFLIGELSKIIKPKELWLSCLSEVKQRNIEASAQSQETAEAINLKKLKEFGFQQKKNYYYTLDKGMDEKKWSNFVLEPLFHIKDSQAALRIFKITNEFDQSDIVEFKQEDLISMAKFNQKIESIGNYLWLAGCEQLTRLKQFLYKDTPMAVMIKQLGWQRNGLFAFGNGIFYDKEFYPVNEQGIAKLPIGNYYLPAFSKIHAYDENEDFRFERSFIYQDVAKFSLNSYMKQMILVFGDNAKIGFAFLVATLFKDVIRRQTKTFPMLNIFGPKSSGKSHLGHCLTAFFISNNIPLNIVTSTLPALAEAVAQSSNALVQLDELSNEIDPEKREFLKGIYDGTGRTRINIEKDKKRETTRVDSGVIVTGQHMATADIALFTRMVFITFGKSIFSTAEVDRFNKLMEMRKMGCTHLTAQLLQLRGVFERNYTENYTDVGHRLRKDLKKKNIEDRIITNWGSILAAFVTIGDRISVPFDFEDLYRVSLKAIIKQGDLCSQNTEIAAFWETIAFLATQNTINYGCEYRIEHVSTLQVEEYSETFRYREPVTVLYLRYLTCYQAYCVQRNRIKESILPKASLQYYLKVSKAYIGRKGSMLFHAIVDGVPVKETVRDKKGNIKVRQKLIHDQVMCFNYDLLKKHYHINLESLNAEDVEDVEAIPEENT